MGEADLWDTRRAKKIAREIAEQSTGNNCGPAVVVWIAAVWNLHKGRSYDYVGRLTNKSLFPDGPRRFTGSAPGFQSSLNAILKRETNNELKLTATYFRYSTIHKRLERYDNPIIIRMWGFEFLDGLHYTALYKTRYRKRRFRVDKIKFYWMDNGNYGRRNGGNPGLYGTGWRNVGINVFPAGAKRVKRV